MFNQTFNLSIDQSISRYTI